MSDTVIKELDDSHIDALLNIIEGTGNISDEEKDCAEELLKISIDKENPESEEYLTLVSETDGHASGYICYGNASLADGAYDIYWILVDEDKRGGGIGSALVAEAEKAVKTSGGRLLIAETSGREEYSSTHEFYKKNGYLEEARIRDFYRKGDDKLFFSKVL